MQKKCSKIEIEFTDNGFLLSVTKKGDYSPSIKTVEQNIGNVLCAIAEEASLIKRIDRKAAIEARKAGKTDESDNDDICF